jgi:hypothetical protein
MGQIAVIEMTANVSAARDLAIEPETPPSYACVFEETSAPVVFTVTNVGDNTSGTIVSDIVGEDAQNFAIVDTDCAVLAPQEMHRLGDLQPADERILR